MKKVTKTTLLNLRFPLPPLAEQNRILERMDAMRQAARAITTQAQSLRTNANLAFQAALFGAPASS